MSVPYRKTTRTLQVLLVVSLITSFALSSTYLALNSKYQKSKDQTKTKAPTSLSAIYFSSWGVSGVALLFFFMLALTPMTTKESFLSLPQRSRLMM